MGPVNWLAVILAAVVATGVAIVWHGPRLRPRGQIMPSDAMPAGGAVLVALVFLIGAVMLGHSFARIGPETLGAKPWLYFMQSGGIALAFVMPAVWLTQVRNRVEPMRRVLDCAFWLVAYLAMGLVFWALG